VRLIVQTRGGWRIQCEAGPDAGDPIVDSFKEALEWAHEIVDREGEPFPPSAKLSLPRAAQRTTS
jgi:hypothetical protein